jgi:alkylhydroperoxidase family enzyme
MILQGVLSGRIASGTKSSRGLHMRTLGPDVDKMIAGAGPTGLALAATLARRGIEALIVDRQPAGANTSRACVVHARTMEVLEPLGVTRDLLALKVPIFRICDRDRPLITWAESLTNIAATHAPDSMYDETRRYFSEKELADLSIAIAMINAWNRLCIGARAVHPEDLAQAA